MLLEHADTAASPSPSREPGASEGRASWTARLVALVAGAVALVGAALLPLLPVTVNVPTVSWPQDPRAPESTVLMLTAYQPQAMDVRFSCQTARLADFTGDGLVLSTVRPTPAAPGFGLVVTAEANRLEVRSAGALLLAEPIPSGGCDYRVQGGTGGLAVTRDGRPVGDGEPNRLPEVEALVTGLTTLPGAGPADLGVRIEVDDRFSTSPTQGKREVIGLVLLALLVIPLVASRLDRGLVRRRPARVLWWPGPADLVVLATLAAWLFLAPISDDDGYYAAMAENVPFEGYVANYYQLYNQSFTPFTWAYVALSKWLVLAGESPVMLRIPALVCGLLTWLLLSRFVAGCHARASREGSLPRRLGGYGGALLLQGVLAVTYLMWWTPQNMGVRPEGLVALFAAGALFAAMAAVERRSLVLAVLAVVSASLGCTVAPTGLIALAPLVAAAPGIWTLIRRPSPVESAARLACVLAPLAVAALAGFADGSLRDFVLSQEIFLGIQEQGDWYAEPLRYEFLLGDSPMGNYAKRASVLVALVALAWFAVLVAAARARRVAVPPRMAVAGWALLVGLLLLSLTPSKPTHHFAALAGLGPAWLALLLFFAPVLVARITGGRRLALPVRAGVVGGAVLAFALAAHGPNVWPFTWMTGLPNVPEPPHLGELELDQPLWWLLAVVVVTGVVTLWAALRAPHWRPHATVLAVPVVVVVFFTATLSYLVGSFGIAAADTWDTYSLQAANLQDPLASDCPTSNAVQVLDERTGRPLPVVAPAETPPAAAGFAWGRGWPDASEPPVAPGTGAATELWGTLVPPPGSADADENRGRWATAWYRMPELAPGETLATLVTGRVGGANSLTLEFATTSILGTQDVIESRPVDQLDLAGSPVDSTAWRTILLAEPGATPPGADTVRLVAEDGATDVGGWLAFGAPTVQRYVPLGEYLPDRDPIAVAWQLAFLFPCLRQPRQQNGITEAPTHAVMWGEGPFGGLGDPLTMRPDRGGAFARAPFLKTVFQPVSRLRGFPDVTMIEVYRYTSSLAPAAYTVSTDRDVVAGG